MSNPISNNGFSMKLWRGERMCLLGFDVDEPEDDFVGFAIEYRAPNSNDFVPLRNRLAFSYDVPATQAVTGRRIFLSTENPFQKFRWIHFPTESVRPHGTYVYRATKMHMPTDNPPVRGTSLELSISLDPVTYDNFLDVGFTRNFASSQAYEERYHNEDDVIPSDADDGLKFLKLEGDVYRWLGFEAYDLIFDLLKEAVDDTTISLDVLAYDFNEPDMAALLKQLGSRLRIIIDDSTKTDQETGVVMGHGVPDSAESQVAKMFINSAGVENVRRTHFSNLQHNKVFIAKRNGQPFKVLTGSTNFSFRGIYIQANNVLVFYSSEVAALFASMFDLAFRDPHKFKSNDLAKDWHEIQSAGQPLVKFCFAPHKDSDISLIPVKDAIENASSVFYSIAFLNQIKSGPTKEAFDNLINRPIFSYGIVDKVGKLEVKKPNGTIGLVDFAYLSKKAPEPFKTEWAAGSGINVHHKFVVTDFNLPTAKVFTGSSNLAPSGEEGNGDNLIVIEDQKIAVSYTIEALRVFDHLHFRSNMETAFNSRDKKEQEAMKLRKPTRISHKPTWFKRYYVADSQDLRDRLLFSK